MCYHIIAFIAGFVLDLLIGDPHFIPHPVRLIGSLISLLDRDLIVMSNIIALKMKQI